MLCISHTRKELQRELVDTEKIVAGEEPLFKDAYEEAKSELLVERKTELVKRN